MKWLRKNLLGVIAAGVVTAVCVTAGAEVRPQADPNTASREGTSAPVPEPATWAVLGLGGILLFRRRR